MLSWSSTTAGTETDITAIATGDGNAGIDYGAELLEFAAAIAGTDDDRLGDARDALVDAAGWPFMVDAAAVAANFEMMTRLADATGAVMPNALADERRAVNEQLGILGIASAR